MMIGIAAVVIVVILLGLFFVKKNRGSNDTTPNVAVHRPKTLAEQQQELETQKQTTITTPVVHNDSTTPAPSADKDLATAQQFIQQHDYNSAIDTLRQSIKSNPNRSDLHFSLLNTFALAKDYQSFEQYYPEVIALNDHNITTQAQNLKNLIDEETALTNSLEAKNSKTHSQESDALDFDLFDSEQSNTQNTSISSLSDNTSSITQANSEDNVDFDFEVNELSTTSTKLSDSDVKAEELSLDDLNFDLTATTVENNNSATHTEVYSPIHSQSSSDALTSDDELADFDLLDTGENIKTTQSVEQPVTDSDLTISTVKTKDEETDFDFDFDLPEPENKNLATTSSISQPTEESQEPIFDLEALETSGTSVKETISKPSVDVDDAFLDDSFLIDASELEANEKIAEPTSAPTVEQHAEPAIISSASTDTIDQLDTLYAEQNSTTTATHQPTQDDEFKFSLDDEITDNEPVSNADDTSLVAAPQPVAPINQPTTEEITDNHSSIHTPVTIDLADAFEFIKDLDTDQLNLDLAEQYINLGEYDSAKRLLNELNNDNPALASKTQVLLQRIS